MRSLKVLICETSNLDPEEGIRFRGYSIPECQKLLPKFGGEQMIPEGIWWLLCTGDIPNDKQVSIVQLSDFFWMQNFRVSGEDDQQRMGDSCRSTGTRGDDVEQFSSSFASDGPIRRRYYGLEFGEQIRQGLFARRFQSYLLGGKLFFRTPVL